MPRGAVGRGSHTHLRGALTRCSAGSRRISSRRSWTVPVSSAAIEVGKGIVTLDHRCVSPRWRPGLLSPQADRDGANDTRRDPELMLDPSPVSAPEATSPNPAAVESVADTFHSVGLSRREGIRSVVRIAWTGRRWSWVVPTRRLACTAFQPRSGRQRRISPSIGSAARAWGSLIPCRTHFRLVCRNDRGVHDR